MRKTLLLFVAILTIALCLAGPANASSEAEKQAAIASGLAWLASTQQADGRWSYDGSYGDTAATASALLAFQEQQTKPGGWFGQDYTAIVNKGYEYLFSQGQIVNIGVQTYGNPDTNGNGIGIKFVPGGPINRDTYVTGLVLPAIAKLPAAGVVASGPLAGRTYGSVVQDVVDYFAWGQNESGTARGAWRYWANSGDSDNSTVQWPAIGMLYAQAAGATVPQFVRDEMRGWIDYIQNANGGSGYDSPGNVVNVAKTGGLLVEMVFAGYDGGAVPNEATALSYLNATWLQNANSTWDGNFGHPYAMWATYKGLQSTIGLGDTTTITNLHPNPGDLDPGHTWNWWEDYCESLVNSQLGNGAWSGYEYWTGALATAWNINILNATQVVHGVPEPGSLLLVLGGLVGLGFVRRRCKG